MKTPPRYSNAFAHVLALGLGFAGVASLNAQAPSPQLSIPPSAPLIARKPPVGLAPGEFGFVRGTNFVGSLRQPRSAALAQLPTRAQTPLALAEVGPDHRLWTSAPGDALPAGAPAAVLTTNTAEARWPARPSRRVVEIATGMNYWDGQGWTPSDPTVELADDGFVAERLRQKVRLSANLNIVGAVTLTGPDGITLCSTPVALGLYDAASGRSLLIAQVSDCAGTLVSSDRVLYQDAFGAVADVVYVIDRASFEQDVVLKPGLNPADYGFDPATARIQVFTEFYDAPEPERITRPIRVEKELAVRQRMASPDLVDEVLGFGELVIATGRAFAAGGSSCSGGPAAPVAKEFKAAAGRMFLVESVEFTSVKGEVESGQASGLVIDYVATLSGTLSGSHVFQGDTTYFVKGPVVCSGAVTIEGGAVFKYPKTPTAYIKLSSTVTCRTSAYRPAVFTAADDDSVGECVAGVCTNYTGVVDGHYANPALWVYYVSSSTLSDLRFFYAQEAIRIEGGTGCSATIAHAQLRQCVRGIVLTGSGSGSGSGVCLTVNNSLMAKLQTPVTVNAANSSANFYHCTIEGSTNLVSSSRSPSLYFVNSILANVTNNVSGSASLSGNYNAFSSANGFGSNQQADQGADSPFAPTTWTDQAGYVWPLIATGQGAYYLRDGSPLRDLGLGTISTSLKNELAKRSTVPPGVFSSDVTWSERLRQSEVRDPGTPDLGYHYPAVDYVVAAATVNNATLTIDQGTVLAFTCPYDPDNNYYPEWGIRVNPGARLIVNGVPTNHVVFARLEAVQENPFPDWQWGGPLITAKGLNYDGDPVEPFAEAKFRYADFPAPTGWNPQLGPLYRDHTYELVGNLEFDGCLFQCGTLLYDSGGPPGRTLILRNNVFERSEIAFWDMEDQYGTDEEQLTAANNLFYNCFISLAPIAGTNWTFIDNIFDHVTFGLDDAGDVLNGPVATNNHNAYVGMTTRLALPAPTSTDPNISSLSYVTGPLGSFYLPRTATALIDKGSRLAKEAGLCHFTSCTDNVKERDETGDPKQVNIGHHYLALVNGYDADTDGDYMPDYQEDANGNGVADPDEPNWQAPQADPVTLPATLSGMTFSGVVEVPVVFDNSAGDVRSVTLRTDMDATMDVVGLQSPFSGPLRIALDTRRLPNGELTFKAVACKLDASEFESAPVTVNVQNAVCFPRWDVLAGEALATFAAEGPGSATDYYLRVYGPQYPKAHSPPLADYDFGSCQNGAVDYTVNWADADFAQGATYYSVIKYPLPGGTEVFMMPPKKTPPGSFPDIGYWVVAYEDSFHHDWKLNPNNNVLTHVRVADPPNPPFGPATSPYYQVALNQWIALAANAGQAPVFRLGLCYDGSDPKTDDWLGMWPPPSTTLGVELQGAQTWPIRFGDYAAQSLLNPKANIKPSNEIVRDWYQLLIQLSSNFTEVRNVYIASHMSETSIGLLDLATLMDWIGHRYRFVFLDGSMSGKGGLLRAFGFTDRECRTLGLDINYYRGLPSGPNGLIPVNLDKPRPAVGLVHSGSPFSAIPYRPQDINWNPPSGLPVTASIPSKYPQFYRDFQTDWWNRAWTVQDALNGAKAAALNSGLYDPRTMKPCDPGCYLTIRGFAEMHFNQFNKASDNWLQ